MFGPIKQEYYRYFCKQCNQYYKPEYSGEVSYGKFTPRMTELLCLEGKDNPFEFASKKIKSFFHVYVNKESIRQVSEQLGKLFFIEHTKEVPFEKLKPKKCDTLFLEIDGSLLNTRSDGWKEYKLGLYYTNSDIQKRKSDIGRVTLKNKQLSGMITSNYLVDLKNNLKHQMQRTGHYWANTTVLISDGAEWISNLFKELFPKCLMILDWYHAIENLYKCANQLFKEGSKELHEWVNFYKSLLWEGKINIVLNKLLKDARIYNNQTPLLNLYHYYNSRKYRMNYKEYRNKGYPIGSGAVESANKYSIQQRLKRSSMKWKINNINYIAHLRNMYYSDQWEEIWK